MWAREKHRPLQWIFKYLKYIHIRYSKTYMCVYIYIYIHIYVSVSLINDIPTFMGYLMPKSEGQKSYYLTDS